MCSPKTCIQCGKTTWSGCGMHVDEVKAKVPADQWCGGHEPTQPSAQPHSSIFGTLAGR